MLTTSYRCAQWLVGLSFGVVTAKDTDCCIDGLEGCGFESHGWQKNFSGKDLDGIIEHEANVSFQLFFSVICATVARVTINCTTVTSATVT